MAVASGTEQGQYSLAGKTGIRLEVTSAQVRVMAQTQTPDNPMTLSVHRPTGYAGPIKVNPDGAMLVIAEKGDPADPHKPQLVLEVPLAIPLQIRLAGTSELTLDADLMQCELSATDRSRADVRAASLKRWVVRAYGKARVDIRCGQAGTLEVSGTDESRLSISASDRFKKLAAYAGGKSRIICRGAVRVKFMAQAVAKGQLAHVGPRPERLALTTEGPDAGVHLAEDEEGIPADLRGARSRRRGAASRRSVTPT